MAPSTGTTRGPYEVVGSPGARGLGEVGRGGTSELLIPIDEPKPRVPVR